MADRILAKRGSDPAALKTLSCTYETSTFSADETPFITFVEHARGQKGFYVRENEQRATLGLEDIRFTGVPNVHHCFPGRYESAEKLMHAFQARVLLTGVGGDHLFWSDDGGSPEIADLLTQRQLRRAAIAARRWSQLSGTPLWKILLIHGVRPLLMGRTSLGFAFEETKFPPWVRSNPKLWLASGGRSQGLRVNDTFPLPSQRVFRHLIRSLSAAISAGYYQEYHTIHFSHPFAHPSLIEFALSVPITQLLRPGDDRSLMRRALRGFLPERVRTRRSKGTVDEVIARAVAREESSIGDVNKFEVCRRGWAQGPHLRRAIHEIALGKLDHSYALVRLMSVERWLRSLGRIEAQRQQQDTAALPCRLLHSMDAERVLG
jgi:hypothetical protein